MKTLTTLDRCGVGVTFSRDGRFLASLSIEPNDRSYQCRFVKLWDAKTFQEILKLGKEECLIYGIALSPDGRRLATVGASGSKENSGELRVWNLTTGREAFTMRGQPNTFNSVAFSSDGRRILTGSQKTVWSVGFKRALGRDVSEVKLWDANMGMEVGCFRGHNDNVTSVDISPDGRRGAAACNMTPGTGEFKIWNPVTGQTISSQRTDDYISLVAFSPDGRRVLTVCESQKWQPLREPLI